MNNKKYLLLTINILIINIFCFNINAQEKNENFFEFGILRERMGIDTEMSLDFDEYYGLYFRGLASPIKNNSNWFLYYNIESVNASIQSNYYKDSPHTNNESKLFRNKIQIGLRKKY